jgi:hypothetical protein
MSLDDSRRLRISPFQSYRKSAGSFSLRMASVFSSAVPSGTPTGVASIVAER